MGLWSLPEHSVPDFAFVLLWWLLCSYISDIFGRLWDPLGVGRASDFIQSRTFSCEISRYATLCHVIQWHIFMYMVPIGVYGIRCRTTCFLLRVCT